MLGEYSQKRNRKIPPPHGPEPHFKTALNGDFDARSSAYVSFTGDELARALRQGLHMRPIRPLSVSLPLPNAHFPEGADSLLLDHYLTT